MAHVRAQEKHSVFVVYYTFCTVSHFGPLLNRHTYTHRNMCAWSLKLPHFHIQYVMIKYIRPTTLIYMHVVSRMSCVWHGQIKWLGLDKQGLIMRSSLDQASVCWLHVSERSQ